MNLSDVVVGMGVVYRPHPDAPAEDGDVTEIRPPLVMVRYVGDRTAKATHPRDLTPLGWHPTAPKEEAEQ